jgi:hypothetical protein
MRIGEVHVPLHRVGIAGHLEVVVIGIAHEGLSHPKAERQVRGQPQLAPACIPELGPPRHARGSRDLPDRLLVLVAPDRRVGRHQPACFECQPLDRVRPGDHLSPSPEPGAPVSRPTFALRARRLPRPLGKHPGRDGDRLEFARHGCAAMENIRADPGPITDARLRLAHRDGAHTPDRAAARRRARRRDGSHHAERHNKDDADRRDHGFQPWGRLKAPGSQGDRGGSKLGAQVKLRR